MIHRFTTDISDIPLPERFTYPFHYTPHPLTVLAAQEVERYLSARTDWQEELRQGKMFGVLVVQLDDGSVGFTAAFSGILAGSNRHDYFVPPVYDLLRPDGFFRREEEHISDINHRMDEVVASTAYRDCVNRTEKLRQEVQVQLETARQALKERKRLREELRSRTNLDEEGRQALVRESQFEKAEYKRLERRMKAELEVQEAELRQWNGQLEAWKQERKSRSAALQNRLFRQFRLLNARGETRDLTELFRDTPAHTPPSGAGECALPKLLQHAYLSGLHPLAFGEFWWGNSPKNEVRRQGAFYPSCQGKCAPILCHTLQGLEVEPDPLEQVVLEKELEVVYEDEWLVVVDKPVGLLSVPGKKSDDSVLTRLRCRYPSATGPLLVHRLDMDTSGLMLAAKTKEVHEQLQRLFETRQVRKRYTALLEGVLPSDAGTIDLPLSPDWLDRPRQKVDEVEGKPALTQYMVRCRQNGRTLVDFFPLTGRTHQLRVHAAHARGLDAPIVGDVLYGTPAHRLCLHAAALEFVHPVTHQRVCLCREVKF